MLAQDDDITSTKPVAFASRTSSQAESRYPQLDLEATSIDFGLWSILDFVTKGQFWIPKTAKKELLRFKQILQ